MIRGDAALDHLEAARPHGFAAFALRVELNFLQFPGQPPKPQQHKITHITVAELGQFFRLDRKTGRDGQRPFFKVPGFLKLPQHPFQVLLRIVRELFFDSRHQFLGGPRPHNNRSRIMQNHVAGFHRARQNLAQNDRINHPLGRPIGAARGQQQRESAQQQQTWS